MSRIRSAFTLIELAVVLAIVGVSGAAMGMLLIRQQRFYRGASELLYAREGVRDALDLLAGDLRGMAVADTVRLLADSAIEMYTTIGSSIVCQATSGREIGLPPVIPAGNTLTAFATEPDTGDLALFYRAIDGNGFWERHRLSAFAKRALSTTCPASSGFSRTEDDANGSQGFQATLEPSLSGDVRPGTPVRFVRRGRYSLYRSSDGEWYVGYRRCNALGESVCGPIQPLSGPYRPYSTDHRATGLLFEYFDRDGARVAASPPLELARVDITARAQSRQSLSVEGRGFRPAESGTIAIAIRNRLP